LQRAPELEKLARAYSGDMAGRQSLSHLSSSGLSYTDRLVEAGVFFAAHAENVACSETFVAEFIHESLMESQGHRENILNGEYDRIGIGVVLDKGNRYYVTQDFIRSLGPEGDEEDLDTHLRELLGKTRERINMLRECRGLLPFVFLEEANVLAQEFAERRMSGLPPPLLPPAYRSIQILYLYITAPSLEQAEPEMSLLEQAQARTGGMGIHFARNGEYPGGIYGFAFLLFLDRNYAEMSEAEHAALVRDQINLLRSRAGLGEIAIDTELSADAVRISRSMLDREGMEAVIPARLAGFRIESYITANPFQVPPEVASHFTRPGIRRIGLGVIFEPDADLPTGQFWITLVFR
jgi:uncharacterized protein YkwD